MQDHHMQQSILIRVQHQEIVNVDVIMNEIITEEMQQLKQLIMQTVTKREVLKEEMSLWYAEYPNERFQKLDNLIVIDGMLSELDSNYKRLWDFHNKVTS
jgi:hypothetical protein